MFNAFSSTCFSRYIHLCIEYKFNLSIHDRTSLVLYAFPFARITIINGPRQIIKRYIAVNMISIEAQLDSQ